MGRQAAGVRGIRLHEKDYVVGMEVVSERTKIFYLLRKMDMVNE